MAPKDPVMLLSFINTKLRDFYPSLEILCEEENLEIKEVLAKLGEIGYSYNKDKNRFE